MNANCNELNLERKRAIRKAQDEDIDVGLFLNWFFGIDSNRRALIQKIYLCGGDKEVWKKALNEVGAEEE